MEASRVPAKGKLDRPTCPSSPAGKEIVVRAALIIGVILVAPTLPGCGSGNGSESVEVNSGVPPYAANLKALVQRHVRTKNEISALDCERAPKPKVGLGHEIWNCDLTTASGNHNAEIEILVGVSNGGYSMLECRTGPRQKYSQTPRGICKNIR